MVPRNINRREREKKGEGIKRDGKNAIKTATPGIYIAEERRLFWNGGYFGFAFGRQECILGNRSSPPARGHTCDQFPHHRRQLG